MTRNPSTTPILKRTLRLPLHPARAYVPQTANSKEPRKIREKANSVAITACPMLRLGLKEYGIAKRS
jgi:hypothetical protein